MTHMRERNASALRARWAAPSLALLALAVLWACDRSEPVATTDSLLRRDLTLASSEYAPGPTTSIGDTAVTTPGRVLPDAAADRPRSAPPAPRPAPAKPAVKPPVEPAVAVEETPVSPTPVIPAPAAPVETTKTDEGTGSTAAGPAPTSTRTLARGVALTGQTNAAICSPSNRPGDRLVAMLANDVVSPDGGRLAAGTPILVELAAPATTGEFVFRVKAIMVNGLLVPIEGVVTVDGPTTNRRVPNGGNGTKIAGGAIVGAILGGIFGGGKGAAIGAAGGAAAGTVAAAGNSSTETCLPTGTALTVTLTAPLVISSGTP